MGMKNYGDYDDVNGDGNVADGYDYYAGLWRCLGRFSKVDGQLETKKRRRN